MRVKLRKMTAKEFEAFAGYSVNDYANDLMKSFQITLEEAVSRSKKEFAEMLPDGADTKDNSLMAIEEPTAGKAIGAIWYLYEMTDGVKQVFLNDFIIKEEERRKDYGAAALSGMESDAKSNGCTESVIYVRKRNLPGISLYTKCGYTAFRELEDGVYMKKQI